MQALRQRFTGSTLGPAAVEGRAGSGSGRGAKLQCGFREGLSQHDAETFTLGLAVRSPYRLSGLLPLVLPLKKVLRLWFYLVIGCQLA